MTRHGPTAIRADHEYPVVLPGASADLVLIEHVHFNPANLWSEEVDLEAVNDDKVVNSLQMQ